jgi:hypothetical protein
MNSFQDLTLDVSQSIEINAAPGDMYRNLILRLTEHSSTADNKPMPMVLEQWPGGRWFRDLGNGQGHLWGFVQVIKPPTLLEIQGPMFMSYPAAGHVQFRVTQTPGGCELSHRHRVIGLIDENHRASLSAGWNACLQDVKRTSEGG